MKDNIPVNPDILRWAREQLHMPLGEVANRMKKEVAVVEAWESGQTCPTYVQLEKLAYEIYRRPLALFFFPEPPTEESIEQTFRTLPNFELQRIPSRIRLMLRKARVLQINLGELFEGINPAERSLVKDIDVAVDINPVNLAEEVRAYLGIQLRHQQSWTSTDDALKLWRAALESCGIFIFKDSFNSPGKKSNSSDESSFSGFCLYDIEFPVIYVNNNLPKTRQIFTLFHELAHLIMHTGGVDTRHDDYIQFLAGDSKRIEVLCNQFAAEFLVPTEDFTAHSRDETIDDSAIHHWAELYSVSRETILRRLLDQGRVDQSYYEEKSRRWMKESRKRGRGGSYFPTKGTYLGVRYVEAVLSRYHQGRISVDQAADYLGDSTKNVPGMENWLFKSGTTV